MELHKAIFKYIVDGKGYHIDSHEAFGPDEREEFERATYDLENSVKSDGYAYLVHKQGANPYSLYVIRFERGALDDLNRCTYEYTYIHCEYPDGNDTEKIVQELSGILGGQWVKDKEKKEVTIELDSNIADESDNKDALKCWLIDPHHDRLFVGDKSDFRRLQQQRNCGSITLLEASSSSDEAGPLPSAYSSAAGDLPCLTSNGDATQPQQDINTTKNQARPKLAILITFLTLDALLSLALLVLAFFIFYRLSSTAERVNSLSTQVEVLNEQIKSLTAEYKRISDKAVNNNEEINGIHGQRFIITIEKADGEDQIPDSQDVSNDDPQESDFFDIDGDNQEPQSFFERIFRSDNTQESEGENQ